MSKTKKNSNKTIGQNENYNMNNRSVLSAQPITLNLIDSHHMNINININTNGNNVQESNKSVSVKKNKKIDLSQISGPTDIRLVQNGSLTNNNIEVSFTLYLNVLMSIHSLKKDLKFNI
jgi:hypothetical protein